MSTHEINIKSQIEDLVSMTNMLDDRVSMYYKFLYDSLATIDKYGGDQTNDFSKQIASLRLPLSSPNTKPRAMLYGKSLITSNIQLVFTNIVNTLDYIIKYVATPKYGDAIYEDLLQIIDRERLEKNIKKITKTQLVKDYFSNKLNQFLIERIKFYKLQITPQVLLLTMTGKAKDPIVSENEAIKRFQSILASDYAVGSGLVHKVTNLKSVSEEQLKNEKDTLDTLIDAFTKAQVVAPESVSLILKTDDEILLDEIAGVFETEAKEDDSLADQLINFNRVLSSNESVNKEVIEVLKNQRAEIRFNTVQQIFESLDSLSKQILTCLPQEDKIVKDQVGMYVVLYNGLVKALLKYLLDVSGTLVRVDNSIKAYAMKGALASECFTVYDQNEVKAIASQAKEEDTQNNDAPSGDQPVDTNTPNQDSSVPPSPPANPPVESEQQNTPPEPPVVQDNQAQPDDADDADASNDNGDETEAPKMPEPPKLN